MLINQDPVPGISASPDEANARYFHVSITGPQDSPFAGGNFKLELFLPEEYPMAAPKVIITYLYGFARYWTGAKTLHFFEGSLHDEDLPSQY